MKKTFLSLILFLTLAGFIDSIYLTWEHFNNVLPPCSVNNLFPILSDCGKVLKSPYSVIFGIPLAVIGVIHYGLLTLAVLGVIIYKKRVFSYWVIIQSIFGALASLYFMYIQFAIIRSLCLYCTLSSLISFTILVLVYIFLKKERFQLHTSLYAFIYQNFVKRIFFLLDPEFIHGIMIKRGAFLAKTPLIKFVGSKLIYKDNSLKQKLAGINFENPIGLAAGFDYNADLTQALYYLDFGFQSVGTITNGAYRGNPKPLLGRLPRSKSLMVNKGFKNKGARAISEKLGNLHFLIPVGVSIGVTNSQEIKSLEEAVKDIVISFKTFEKARVKNSYYELNISCPNLVNAKKFNFYPQKNLDLLLAALDKMKLKKPIFIKMPIEKTNQEVVKMLDVIVKHKSIKGVIFGNLQKNRKDPSLLQSEVKKFKVGFFSGKPCEKRSNELIKLAYKKFGEKLVIIGCGGIFNAEDAYKKIKLGASLVQLITGMIFQGPQLISQINLELIDLAKRDGFKNIKEAVGIDSR
ncbi:MAG: dihydroorotate dehydrogenase 2, nonfunctional [Candidatus Roizmanbacteria bacterium GW2011_GWC1_37_12]|nr:MAG: dihydroorotate dehydrogenase 2, nonfunctional [Candidatus Roizmanbacteria bacterium GW2011_GWC1_37_12]